MYGQNIFSFFFKQFYYCIKILMQEDVPKDSTSVVRGTALHCEKKRNNF